MIITYHEIVHNLDRYLYAVELVRLKEHIDLLHRRAAAMHAPVGITFDDGLESQRDAAVVLEEAGFRGTFFVTASWVGTPGYMDRNTLRGLVAAGHQVQSHGWSHELLTRCGPEDLHRELRQSKEALEDWLGHDVDAVSAPGGACNRTVLAAAARAGYQRVFTSDPWLKPTSRDGVEVTGRLMLRNSTTAARLEQVLLTENRLLSLDRLAYTTRRGIRAALGASLYHRVWCLLARGGFHESNQPRA